jgi:hypothetical protein
MEKLQDAKLEARSRSQVGLYRGSDSNRMGFNNWLDEETERKREERICKQEDKKKKTIFFFFGLALTLSLFSVSMVVVLKESNPNVKIYILGALFAMVGIILKHIISYMNKVD